MGGNSDINEVNTFQEAKALLAKKLIDAEEWTCGLYCSGAGMYCYFDEKTKKDKWIVYVRHEC